MTTSVRVGWIALLCVFTMQAVVGYTIAFAIESPLWSWHQEAVATALWEAPAYPVEAAAFRGWSMAVLGSTIASWSVAMIWVVAIPLRRGERWAWSAIITSTLAWFLVDTAMSLSYDVSINVWFNIAAISMIALPLAMTWPLRRSSE